jgi:hypothetical protein
MSYQYHQSNVSQNLFPVPFENHFAESPITDLQLKEVQITQNNDQMLVLIISDVDYMCSGPAKYRVGVGHLEKPFSFVFASVTQ